MLLIFDAATTGLIDFRKNATEQDQPHLIQLAAALCDKSFEIKASVNLLLRWDDAVSSEKAREKHGISDRLLSLSGMRPQVAMAAFFDLCRGATTVAAYNMTFQARVIEIAAGRCGGVPATWTRQSLRKACTSELASSMLAEGGRLSVSDAGSLLGFGERSSPDSWQDLLVSRKVLEVASARRQFSL